MSKKGFELWPAEIVKYIERYIAVIFILATFWMLGSMVLKINVNTAEAETMMISNNLLLNPDGIIYATNYRGYLGTVDCNKFNVINLNTSMNTGNLNFTAMNLSLYSYDKELIKEVVYNPFEYYIWVQASGTELKGTQSAVLVVQDLPVVLKNCEHNAGLLKMRVVMSR